jgi:hypothetical protein
VQTAQVDEAKGCMFLGSKYAANFFTAAIFEDFEV